MKIRIQSGLDHITDRKDLLHDFVIFVCKDLRIIHKVRNASQTVPKSTPNYSKTLPKLCSVIDAFPDPKIVARRNENGSPI